MTAQIRSRSCIAVVVAVAILMVSAGRPVEAASAAVTVEITDFAFQPGSITVAPGSTITWVNDDEEAHTITSTEGVFKSEALESAGRFSHTFTKPGTYHYFCALHPHMRADVIVR